MNEPISIAAVEAALVRERVSVARICRRAEISGSTWHRWKKQGVAPRDSSWDRVKHALSVLAPAVLDVLPSSDATKKVA